MPSRHQRRHRRQLQSKGQPPDGLLTAPALPAALRCFEPKIPAWKKEAMAMCHNQNLDGLVREGGGGKGSPSPGGILRDWVASVFLWSRVAEVLGRGVDEMARQMDLSHTLIARYSTTGVIGLSAEEYQIAREGVLVMDTLTELVDLRTATEASYWREDELNKLLEPTWSAPVPQAGRTEASEEAPAPAPTLSSAEHGYAESLCESH